MTASECYGAMAILLVACATLLVWALVATADYRAAARRLQRYQFMSPHARMLGRVVEVKKFEGSEWERAVVVAVSRHGAVCVRRLSDMEARGFWLNKDLAPHRVREIER